MIDKEQFAKDYETNPEDYFLIVMDGERKKGKRQDGRAYDFIAWQGWDKYNKRATFKFVKTVQNVPTEEGTYKFILPKFAMHRDKSTRYATYWINEITEVKPYSYETSREIDETLPF